MSQSDIASICSALRALSPFADLSQNELEIIARHGKERTFKAGALILPKATMADMLVVQMGGSAVIKAAIKQAGAPQDKPAPVVFDAPGLLFGLATVGDYVAGADGMDALLFAKPHVYTMALECPAFTIGVLHMQESRAQ